MRGRGYLGAVLLAGALTGAPAVAQLTQEPSAAAPVPAPQAHTEAPVEASGIQKLISDALGLVGIRYRRGGKDAETGFDCSGFVGYLFRERLGLDLPRTSRDISRAGEPVEKSELEPGDLVFFNTMRRAFSHVGIYLGNNQFVHSPRSGYAVRVEDMSERYWAKRYNGARRVDGR